MRIIAGKFKGNKLYLPKNKNTRPLKDQAREAIFNLLIHSNKVFFKLEKSNILDLYSGTGSFGLECLSRSADRVLFIEKDNSAVKVLKKNIYKLKLEKKTNVYVDDVVETIKNQNLFLSKFDLIFCDPPFKNLNVKNLVRLISDKNLLKDDGILVLHRRKNSKESCRIKSQYYNYIINCKIRIKFVKNKTRNA